MFLDFAFQALLILEQNYPYAVLSVRNCQYTHIKTSTMRMCGTEHKVHEHVIQVL